MIFPGLSLRTPWLITVSTVTALSFFFNKKVNIYIYFGIVFYIPVRQILSVLICIASKGITYVANSGNILQSLYIPVKFLLPLTKSVLGMREMHI